MNNPTVTGAIAFTWFTLLAGRAAYGWWIRPQDITMEIIYPNGDSKPKDF